ncbi:MAG: hypothetical protein ACPHRO_01265, partial [Nannocystaceae bacterium]
CAWVAHADDVLEVGEWDLMVKLLEGGIPEEDEAEAMAMVMDKSAVAERMAGIEVAADVHADSVLALAWRMALSDGSAADSEVAAHDEIAQRLGVSPDAAATLRDNVSSEVSIEAEVLISFAAGIISSDGRVDASELVEFDDLISGLPVEEAKREALVATLHDPPSRATTVARFAGLSEHSKLRVMHQLGPFVAAAHRGDAEASIAVALAVEAGMDEADARAALSAGYL